MQLRHILLLLILSFPTSVALTALGLLHTEHVSITDSQYTKYGFPYWWIVHVTVTIAGPTDIWQHETSNLLRNIALFFTLSLGLGYLILLLTQRTTHNISPQCRSSSQRTRGREYYF